MAVTEVMEASGALWPEAHTNPRTMAALSLASNRLTGVENVGVPFCMTVEAELMGANIDIGARHIEPRVIDYAINSPADWQQLKSLDAENGRAATCAEAIKILKKQAPDVPLFANLTGPISLAGSLVDPLLFYKALIKDKETANALLEFCAENLIRFGDAMLDAGADLICIADPSATGELIGKTAFREFAIPYLNRITDHFHNRETPVIIHICGNVKTLGKALSELNAEIISIDSLVSIRMLRSLAGDKLTMGNVSTYLQCMSMPTGVPPPGRKESSRVVLAPSFDFATQRIARYGDEINRLLASGEPTAVVCEKIARRASVPESDVLEYINEHPTTSAPG